MRISWGEARALVFFISIPGNSSVVVQGDIKKQMDNGEAVSLEGISLPFTDHDPGPET